MKTYSKFIFFAFFSFVLCVSILTRFYNLGQTPHGMTWDEAAIGYNGYAILTTRRDEWLQRLPISFRSFGDYKAPLAIYLNGVFTYTLGMNLHAVRLPFALFGLATIICFFFLLKATIAQRKPLLALFGMFLIATTPWHHHFSRVGFEAGISLFFLICSITFFSYLCNREANHDRYNYFSAIAAALSLSASMYAYHSAKLVAPLLLITFVCLHYRKVQSQLKYALLTLIVAIVSLYPLLKDSIWGKGLERASVTLFSDYTITEALPLILNNFMVHLNPMFLIFGQTTSYRHGDGHWGVFLITSFVLSLAGIIAGIMAVKHKHTVTRNQFFFALAWFMIGILPAAITKEVPHSNRAFLALPGFIMLAVIGIESIYAHIMQVKEVWGIPQKIIWKLGIGTWFLLHSLLFISYIHDYYSDFSVRSTEDFKDGYLEVFQLAEEYEKGLNGKQTVDKILFTSTYGQPYIYALFVRKTNPIWYQGGSLIKYEFTDKITVGDLDRNNTLIVTDNTTDLPLDKASHIIYGSDQTIRFRVYLSKNN